MSFYLTYRPQKLSELDLVLSRQAISDSLQSKIKPHAWLFSGPKGTGKTSSARIVAKSVNCLQLKKHSPEPCNRCSNCVAITKGTALDVIEIDAASNRGIDDIRELRDKIKLTPAVLKYKVYIIDEAHMLTKEAFNALLKTLEEPPVHALFILATTEPDKLPPTVVSRCLVIQFNQATPEELVRALNRVVKQEKLKISAEGLARVALVSDGSFRDAVKLLEQLIPPGGSRQISAERVAGLVQPGLTSQALDDWLSLVFKRQTKPAIDWLQQAWKEGLRPKQLTLAAIARLRQVLLGQLGVIETKAIPGLEDIDALKELLKQLLVAAIEVKTSVIDTLPLELAVVARGQSEPAAPAPVPGPAVAKPARSKEKILSKWPQVLAAVKPLNHSLEALLRATEPAEFTDGFLMIKVYYQFHKDRLEEERYRAMVEQIATKVLVTPVKIKYFFEGLKPVKDEDIIKTAEEVFGVDVQGGD